MPDKAFQFGPVALINTYTTNLLNPPTASGGVNAGSSAQKIVLNHIHVANKTSGAVTFRLFLGATGANAAGTELFYDKSVPANDAVDYYNPRGWVLTSADFLVGGASANTSLVISGSGVIMVSG